VNLTEEILTKSMADRYSMGPPTHFYIHADLARIYDRLLNPWKGRRAIWLKRKRR
jgi:hypothetical protein